MDNYGKTFGESMRTFETGATRDTDQGKNDYRGFISPSALRRYGDYMTKHRVQPDGTLRSSDNWKKGMPIQEYVSSGWRHWLELVEAYEEGRLDLESACAMLFNVQGFIHEALKAQGKKNEVVDWFEDLKEMPETCVLCGEGVPHKHY